MSTGVAAYERFRPFEIAGSETLQRAKNLLPSPVIRAVTGTLLRIIILKQREGSSQVKK
jgi:hypothetical protein